MSHAILLVYAVEVICCQEHILDHVSLVGWLDAINRPHPEIKANAYPHAQLRLVVDARGLDQKLPRGDG